ncbi:MULTISPECIES: hypothetical protein [Pseudomonas]|uniref:Uncharacterized protein n=1 Tax=Pseudomonas segetis TaxID=298908 RepID=A0A239H7J2_9PSED|nr:MULTISPECIES: hypothetical protein [Pseudomonas]SNS77416.1 hypothetical protein SAMN05216255_3334 [Pseudomonas segetis]
MVRIRGKIGDWPVDLTVELDAQDWAHLAANLPVSTPPATTEAAPVEAPRTDALWQSTLSLLGKAGSIEGPLLMEQLTGLAGGELAAKQLLVRLRHCAQVRVESGADAPVYHWLG